MHSDLEIDGENLEMQLLDTFNLVGAIDEIDPSTKAYIESLVKDSTLKYLGKQRTFQQNYVTSSGYEILDKDVIDCRTGEEYKRWSKAPLHSPNEGDEIILATYEDGKLVLKNFAIQFKLSC